jgi:hypothetical protein
MNNSITPFLEQPEWRKRFLYRGWQLEPIEHTFGADVAITRSNYGYRVLNTPLLGMVDVDLNPQFDTEAQKKEALANMEEWAKAKQQSWIVYETAGGLRMLRVDAPMPLDDSYLETANSIFGADKLYAKLCIEQKAFRMRVSPKPYRIGAKYPHWNPYDGGFDPVDEMQLPRHIAAYEDRANQFRICKRIAHFGGGMMHYSLYEVVRIHDGLTGANSVLQMEASASKDLDDSNACDDLQLVAFNEVYRPHGYASDLLWHVLPGSFSSRLRELEGQRMTVIAEWDRCQPVVAKWNGTEYVPAETMLKRYKAEALMADQVPLTHRDPAYDSQNCQCDYCVAGRKADAEWKAKMAAENAAAPADDDEDYFAKLARGGKAA